MAAIRTFKDLNKNNFLILLPLSLTNEPDACHIITNGRDYEIKGC
jgi:hypothetical protein